MIIHKRWSFGLGTIFSLIVAYFIYLYSKERGWELLAFISKAYLFVAGGIIAVIIVFVILMLLLLVLMISIASFKLKRFEKKYKKYKAEEFIDAEFKVKD